MAQMARFVISVTYMTDPFKQFSDWYQDARKAEPDLANAMTLATMGDDGLPDARIVLLKELEEGAFVFYTNLESAKGLQLANHPKAALVFHWKSLMRQVRVRGLVTPVPNQQADEYFAGRPRESKIGAWASDQSRPMEGMFVLERRVAKQAARFGVGEVPRPPHWSGFRVTPLVIEFWQDKPFRLHEREVFSRDGVDDPDWQITRLFP